jgi:NADP-dependent 3-hydroxy acid dehydrogenase YdfG
MVNNAGVNPFDNLIEGDVEKWREAFDVNVIGLALGCREAYRVMQGKGGHIVNVTSVAARYAEPESPIYAGTKHAAGAITESIRIALAPKNIRVTAVMPGAVATSLVRSMPQEQLFAIGRMFGIDPEAVGMEQGEHVPDEVLDRVKAVARNVVLWPEDVAEAVLYAVSAPETVQLNEIMIRPLQQLQMPGVTVPA